MIFKVLIWIRKNLFSSFSNSIVTILILWFLYRIIPGLVDWFFLSADFSGTTKQDCRLEGACWVFIKQRLLQLTYGFYPYDQLWRVNLSALIVGVSIFASLTGKLGSKVVWLILTSTIVPLFVWFFLKGSIFGLQLVETSQWGGLLVTLVLSFVGILFSLPIGMVLALARRSKLPVLRVLSTLFIECWRGVPLITVLFMSSVLFPIFLPPQWQIDKLLRALLGVLFFASVYMAEVIRGGLQALPKGQYEAADSLGLSAFQKNRFIILPQALRHVIPAIVNIFISLLKDTSLVSIIGMYDLLGIIQAANSDPKWLGFATEGYVFVGLVFWLMCFSISRYSIRLEKTTATTDRKTT